MKTLPGILSHVARFGRHAPHAPSTPRTFAGTITADPYPRPMGVQRAEAATATIRRAHLTLCHGGLYGRRPTLRATLHTLTRSPYALRTIR